MAKPVLYRATAAGSNYWLGCGKWGQMHCIIREPVDSGSPSQWLVINKIIGERWQRFLEFFPICMSFCYWVLYDFFFSSVKVESLMILCPMARLACVVDSNWARAVEERGEAACEGCTCTLARCNILFCGVIQSHFLHKCHFHRCSSHYYVGLKCATSLFKHCCSVRKPKKAVSTSEFLLLAPEDVSLHVFISVILTITPVMSTQAASFRIPFTTSHAQIGRCLSLLFQLYFSRLRCHHGTCFLDNAVVISPFYQVLLIWADMKTLHVYFLPC